MNQRQSLFPFEISAKRQLVLGSIILAAALIIAVYLHLLAGFHFPTPWNDENDFLLPALRFSREWSLIVPELNAPQGLFWMPDGYYFVMGLIFRVIPPSLDSARLISLLFVSLFAICIYLTANKVNISPAISAILISVWLLSPAAIITGNMARMESLILAILGIALVFFTYGKHLLGIAIASLMSLVHPMGIPLFLCFLAVGVIFRKHLNLRLTGRVQTVIILLIITLWIAELLHFGLHFELFRQHITWQLVKKSTIGRALYGFAKYVLCFIGLLMVWGFYLAEPNKKRFINFQLLAPLAVALIFIDPIGNETWYEIYTNTGNLVITIVFVGLIGALRPDSIGWFKLRQNWKVALVIIVLSAFILVNIRSSALEYQGSPIIPYSFEGMQITDGTREEYYEFENNVLTQLKALDASVTQPKTVMIDVWGSLGNLHLTLHDLPWKHLQFVQITPVTPFEPNTHFDYALFVFDKPDWKRTEIAKRFPSASQCESHKISSNDGVFEVIIFDTQLPACQQVEQKPDA